MAEAQTGQNLLRRAVAGERAALTRLLRKNHQRLAAQVERRIPAELRSTVSADDVLQETYVVVYREIEAFEPRTENAFYCWLAKIAEFRLFDALRVRRAAKRGGRRATVAETSSVIGLLEMLAAHEDTPSRAVVGRDNAVAVRAVLANLKDDQREALRLRYIESLSVAEIAARMKRTEGAVHQLCHRGLRQMQNDLGAYSDYFSRKQ